MKRAVRSLVFAAFLVVFLVGAPAVVLYTAGYRYNPQNGRIVRTGALSVSSTPRGAAIAFDGVSTGQTTPFVFSRIAPGRYTVTLTKDGYHPYEDDTTIESGKTSYLSDVTLFAAGEPVLLTAEPTSAITSSRDGSEALVLRRSGSNAEVWRYDLNTRAYTLLANVRTATDDVLSVRYRGDDMTPILVNSTAGTETEFGRADTTMHALFPATQTVGKLLLATGASAVEVRNTDAPETLLAVLPLGSYTVAQTNGQYAILTTTDDKLYVLDMVAPQPMLLSTRATTFAWDTHAGLLVWTDGIETYLYTFATNTRTFVTRQSDRILDVAVRADGNTVCAASAQALQLFNVGGTGTHTVTLAVFDTLEQCWTDHAMTDALYVVGTVDGVRGIYALLLR